MHLSIFDTSVSTENLGDYIIMDSVNKELREVFPNYLFVSNATHERIGLRTYSMVRHSSYSILGGSNILTNNIVLDRQWKITIQDVFFINELVLMGVGWRTYQPKVDYLTRLFYHRLLSKNVIHSVRDSYTEEKLNSLGISNVINTGCPTMWKLTKEHCTLIPDSKCSKVVFTLTDYRKDEDYDRKLLSILRNEYSSLFFWPQGAQDLDYLKEIDSLQGITILQPNLSCFDELLLQQIDYIGTRLHAGIRALQFKSRTIIIGVDNRAVEKSRDFNIPMISRLDLHLLTDKIGSSWHTEITIPEENIKLWKEQF